MKKTATKTAIKPGRNGNVLPAVGAHPGNTGGKPGRSGRIESAVTQACREIIEKHKLIEVVQVIATSADKSTDRLAAIRLLLEYSEGKPLVRQELSGPDGGRINVGLHIFESDDPTD